MAEALSASLLLEKEVSVAAQTTKEEEEEEEGWWRRRWDSGLLCS